MGQHLELLTRPLVGTLLAAIIGYERHLHGRPADLRTHLLVGLASTTFMLVSTQFVYFQHYTKDDLIAVDPSRIAASVVTGVGFLGGGTILRTGLNVQGLTTAAGLWLVAAIGLSAGAGMYSICVASTALGVIALTVLRRFERKEDALPEPEDHPGSRRDRAAASGHHCRPGPARHQRGAGRVRAPARRRAGSGHAAGQGFPDNERGPPGRPGVTAGVRRVRIEPLP
jgi:uncharacterized membrane protein YhiD involved in acid resistance